MNEREEKLIGRARSLKGAEEIVNLLKEGADPNTQTMDGWTVLMEASVNNIVENVRRLLAGGAGPEFSD